LKPYKVGEAFPGSNPFNRTIEELKQYYIAKNSVAWYGF